MWIAAARRNRGLHEGRLGHVLDDETPGLILRPLGGQPAQQLAPSRRVGDDHVAPRAVQRHSGELDTEAVPRCALVRPQEREVEDAIVGVGR